MKLVGLMPVRNEAWVLGLSARAALMWCDALVILDHASTDGTRAIIFDLLGEFPGRVIYERVDDAEWREMQHRQFMLETARERGATHIAIIDADEVLTGHIFETTRFNILLGLENRAILQLPGYNLRGSINGYHSNGIWGNRWFSTVFIDNARLSWNGDQFHHREPKGIELKAYRPMAQGQGGVMHLWGASERRLRAKSALYKITERLRWPDKPVYEIEEMYSWAIHGSDNRTGIGTPATWAYRDVPSEWWAPYAHLMHYLDLDSEPWQEQECRRMVALHGADRFAGLDLFGVA
jgi:hypothetical protein